MMRARLLFAAGTTGPVGAAPAGAGLRCPRHVDAGGDSGDTRDRKQRLSPLSPAVSRQWGQRKPLWHQAVPTVPVVPVIFYGDEDAL